MIIWHTEIYSSCRRDQKDGLLTSLTCLLLGRTSQSSSWTFPGLPVGPKVFRFEFRQYVGLTVEESHVPSDSIEVVETIPHFVVVHSCLFVITTTTSRKTTSHSVSDLWCWRQVSSTPLFWVKKGSFLHHWRRWRGKTVETPVQNTYEGGGCRKNSIPNRLS